MYHTTGQEASDLIPVLVVLGATVTIVAGSGDRRSVPVSAFVKGGGKVDLQPDELILSIRTMPFPPPFIPSRLADVARAINSWNCRHSSLAAGRSRRVLQAVRPPDEQRLPGTA
jgi:CO/xanthine dehydrogenase FAD-binding subunit